MTESENNFDSTVPSGNEVLSILLQQDGLSFAVTDNGKIRMKKIDLAIGNPGELRRIFSSEWDGVEFRRVWICVPTDKAVLIPAGLNRTEHLENMMTGSGINLGPEACILATSVPPEKILLHAVNRKIADVFRERFGQSIFFFHPLFANLSLATSNDTILQLDVTGKYACYTLTKGDHCLFCDVLPADNPDDILFQIDRIIAGTNIGDYRIVCSGEQADSRVESLSRHFQNVSLHPDFKDRNLLFPIRCE